MPVKSLYHKWASWRCRPIALAAIVILSIIVLLVVCTLRLWEPRAPQRSFKLGDLLIGQEVIPPVWKDAWGPFVQGGEDFCTTDCIMINFGVSGRQSSIQASHEVYRYLSAGIAQRTFDKVYLPLRGYFEPVDEWTYQSPLAKQTHFGCSSDGRSTPTCEWAGVYEEFIVIFWVRMTPGEVSLADVEKAVRAIDARMASYLNSPVHP